MAGDTAAPLTSGPQGRAGDALERLNPRLMQRGGALLRLLRRQIDRVIATYLKKGEDYVVVDYGCGSMPYRPLLAPYVSRYIGSDFPNNDKADVHLRADGTVPLPDGLAHIVLSTQVLEHVVDPFKYLGECRRILKVGGLLVLSTHGIYQYHRDPEDLWRWTSPGLTSLLTQWNFRVVSLEGAMGLVPAGLMLLQRGITRKAPKWLQPAIENAVQPVLLALDRIHSVADRRKDASVFVVVAVRVR